mmetsp:Transcript_29198/g.90258  ORF Transcript_29198/g.90258 Transcript_29198/m.90258 type:complete len:263 (-) Transcript_29198:976-1764(-)
MAHDERPLPRRDVDNVVEACLCLDCVVVSSSADRYELDFGVFKCRIGGRRLSARVADLLHADGDERHGREVHAEAHARQEHVPKPRGRSQQHHAAEHRAVERHDGGDDDGRRHPQRRRRADRRSAERLGAVALDPPCGRWRPGAPKYGQRRQEDNDDEGQEEQVVRDDGATEVVSVGWAETERRNEALRELERLFEELRVAAAPALAPLCDVDDADSARHLRRRRGGREKAGAGARDANGRGRRRGRRRQRIRDRRRGGEGA